MRHAARAGSADALSPEGHKQAESLAKSLEIKILKHFGAVPTKFKLCCSPKLRTQQTLRFLRESLHAPLEVYGDLDERTGVETQSDLEMRVKSQLNAWTAEAESLPPSNELSVTVACSHLDWLEAAALFIDSDELELQRAETWAPLSLKFYGFANGIWRRMI